MQSAKLFEVPQISQKVQDTYNKIHELIRQKVMTDPDFDVVKALKWTVLQEILSS